MFFLFVVPIGLVIGFEIEFGYFNLSELQLVKGSLGLPIERVLYFELHSFENYVINIGKIEAELVSKIQEKNGMERIM